MIFSTARFSDALNPSYPAALGRSHVYCKPVVVCIEPEVAAVGSKW